MILTAEPPFHSCTALFNHFLFVILFYFEERVLALILWDSKDSSPQKWERKLVSPPSIQETINTCCMNTWVEMDTLTFWEPEKQLCWPHLANSPTSSEPLSPSAVLVLAVTPGMSTCPQVLVLPMGGLPFYMRQPDQSRAWASSIQPHT